MTKEEQERMQQLETENKKLKGDLKDAEDKAKTSEDTLKQKDKAEETADLESFKGEVEELVKTGQVKPLERDQLIATYESAKDRRTKVIEFGDTKLSFKESLLAPYKERPKSSTTKVGLSKEVGKIRVKEGISFERDSVKGRNEFHDHVAKQVSEIEVLNYMREKGNLYMDKDQVRAILYEQKRGKVLAESESIND